MRHFSVVFAALAIVLLAHAARAHAVGVSRGEYRASGPTIRALYVFSGAELATALPALDTDHDGQVSSAEARSGASVLDLGVLRATRVTADDAPCAPHLDGVAVTEADAVEIRGTFACARDVRRFAIACDFLERFSPEHRHLAMAALGGRETASVVTRADRTLEVDAGPSLPRSASFAQMVATGIRHILTGYDHLAFLVGLLLLGGRVRTLVGIVTAFTVAHSITLGLAALHVVSLSPSLVEPAIALSIAYVGVENLFVHDPSRRWRITFPFGLLHGFGFAGALTELDLPRAQLPGALFAFNLGVELGQLGVLAVVLPLIFFARRRARFRRWGVPILSVAIALAGFAWFVQRVSW